jgi:uncharacterized protein
MIVANVLGDLSTVDAVLVFFAGMAAGFINAIVGSGTLISFPTLVGVGVENLAANMANNIGLFPGSVSAAYGYRRELTGQRARLLRLAPASTLGAIVGATLLITQPTSTFKAIVPYLILLGVALVIAQPFVQKRVRARREASDDQRAYDHVPLFMVFLVFVTGIYGGYFGAGQGVILVGMLGMVIDDSLVRINATKNVLAAIVNGVAAVIFVFNREVSWGPAILIAISSVIGAQLGSSVGRRIPATVLRTVIVAVGLFAATKLFLS